MPKKSSQKLKLPDDFLGTVQAFLNTPPPPKEKPKPKARPKGAKKR